MRTAATTLGLVLVVTAFGQGPPAAPTRYGVVPLGRQYDQSSPKSALRAAVELIATDRADYLAAHLLEPAFVDARVQERAKRVELDVEREFRRLRDEQRRDATLPGSQRLPDEPAAFARRVQAEATQRGFRQLVTDVRAHLAENPDHLADLRRLLRAGQVLENGDAASFTVREVGKTAYLKKSAAGWHLEDRRTEK